MKVNKFLFLLFFFIFYDLSGELKILFDHFTFNALYFAFLRHPLAFFIVVSLPYLIKKVNKN
tara:strand:+ start:7594 stop:7779 length:186 start_codon:yes stop_codon:yes gene_type:complete